MLELRPDQIEALKRIEEQSKLEKALHFNKKTELLDDLLEENNLKDEIYNELYQMADKLKEKYNMSIEDRDIVDDLIHVTNSNTLKAVTSLKNILIVI